MRFNLFKQKYVYYLAWVAVSLFYFYQYILRVSPGVMSIELRQTFKLTAEEFSSLGAIYLYAYSFLQIPLGFILDRIGVKRVILFSIFICLSGTLLFALAHQIWMLQAGRFLIGIGSAPAFICALKIVSDFLPPKVRGLLMGATLSIGTIGALLSGHVLVSILESWGWQNSLFFCAGFGGLILLIALLFIPSSISALPSESLPRGHFYKGLKSIFQQKEILIYAITAVGVYTPLCILADLWGTIFLIEKFNLGRAQSAQLSLYMYGGLTIGSLLIPWISAKIGRLRETIQGCAIGLMFALLVLLYVKTISLGQLTLLLTIIGVLCGAEMVCFTGASQYASSTYSGLTLGIVNTLNMLGGAVAQQIIGWYLDFHWKGGYGQDGARFYGADELTSAFSLLVLLILGCALLTIKLPRQEKTTLSSEDPLSSPARV
jgi:MFS family permease